MYIVARLHTVCDFPQLQTCDDIQHAPRCFQIHTRTDAFRCPTCQPMVSYSHLCHLSPASCWRLMVHNMRIAYAMTLRCPKTIYSFRKIMLIIKFYLLFVFIYFFKLYLRCVLFLLYFLRLSSFFILIQNEIPVLTFTLDSRLGLLLIRRKAINYFFHNLILELAILL